MGITLASVATCSPPRRPSGKLPHYTAAEHHRFSCHVSEIRKLNQTSSFKTYPTKPKPITSFNISFSITHAALIHPFPPVFIFSETHPVLGAGCG